MGVHDDARDLVPRMNNVTSFYPSISNDSKLVVFNQSTCGTDPDVNRSSADTLYGNQSCDGYDDTQRHACGSSTRPAATPVELDNANGAGGAATTPGRASARTRATSAAS